MRTLTTTAIRQAARKLAVAALLLLCPAMAVSQAASSQADSTQRSVGGLGPGDYILLRIWREPDLSDTIQVDNGGVAVFPKLGAIPVTGIGSDSLERMLVQGYSQYLQNPSIRVTILRRITISGAVARPGTYPVDLTMGINDALALAGGPNAEGSDKVQLRRGNTLTTVDLSGKSGQVGDLSLRSGDELVVPRRSWISRNPGLIVASIGTLTSILYLLARR